MQQQSAMKKLNFHILCTRQLDDALISKASLSNIHIDTASFIETVPVNNKAITEQIRAISLEHITAVFTSMNAADAVINQLADKPAWQICSLGGITKEHLLHFFGKDAIIATAKNATALCEKILAQKKITEVVFFCGDHRLDELPETLRRHNVSVQEVVVYHTIHTPEYTEKDYDGVMFFSPSAVHSFFSVNTLPVNVVLFAIGKTTAATIQTYCTNPVITSEWPGREQMVDLAIHYFTNASISEH